MDGLKTFVQRPFARLAYFIKIHFGKKNNNNIMNADAEWRHLSDSFNDNGMRYYL